MSETFNPNNVKYQKGILKQKAKAIDVLKDLIYEANTDQFQNRAYFDTVMSDVDFRLILDDDVNQERIKLLATKRSNNSVVEFTLNKLWFKDYVEYLFGDNLPEYYQLGEESEKFKQFIQSEFNGMQVLRILLDDGDPSTAYEELYIPFVRDEAQRDTITDETPAWRLTLSPIDWKSSPRETKLVGGDSDYTLPEFVREKGAFYYATHNKITLPKLVNDWIDVNPRDIIEEETL